MIHKAKGFSKLLHFSQHFKFCVSCVLERNTNAISAGPRALPLLLSFFRVTICSHFEGFAHH